MAPSPPLMFAPGTLLALPQPDFKPDSVALASPPAPTQFAAATWPARTWTAAEVANDIEMNQIRDQLNALHDTQQNSIVAPMPRPIFSNMGADQSVGGMTFALAPMPRPLAPFDTLLIDVELHGSTLPYMVISYYDYTNGATLLVEPRMFIQTVSMGQFRLTLRRHAVSNNGIAITGIGGGVSGAAGVVFSTQTTIPNWDGLTWPWYIYFAHGGVPAGGVIYWKWTVTLFPGGY